MYYHIAIYCLKIITFLYLNNAIKTTGSLTMNDIGVSMGLNSVLFYVISVLGNIYDPNMNIFFLDLIVQSICLGLYVNNLDSKNNDSINKTTKFNEKCSRLQTKPIQAHIHYPDMKIIALLSFSPYYLLLL